MPFYAAMNTREEKNVILRMRGKWIYETACRDAHHLCATVWDVSAKDLSKTQKDNAIDVESWYDFEKEYDFGGTVQKCEVCSDNTLHNEQDNCVLCEERIYKLHIWVEPRQEYDERYNLREATEESWRFKMRAGFKREIVSVDNVHQLLNLMDQAATHSLQSTIHAIVTHDIMEDERIVNLIKQKSMGDLNIYEIRWYYVRTEQGVLEYFVAKIPPHWS